MLEFDTEARTLFNEIDQTFEEVPSVRLRLEHSLLSLSKWESKWEVPFLVPDEKTPEQLVDYVLCMSLDRNLSRRTVENLSAKDVGRINDYIARKGTATTFSYTPRGGSRQIVTSEVIYGWMVAYQIDWAAERWPLQRLLTLIRVCEAQQNPKKGRTNKMAYEDKMALNLRRQKELGSSG